MGDKTYRFSHDLGREEARRRILPLLENLCQTYGLTMEFPEQDPIGLLRPGVSAEVRVSDREVAIRVDLNWFLEKAVRKQVEDRLHQWIPEVLKPSS